MALYFEMQPRGDSLSQMASDKGTDKQMEQLCALYAERNDDELLNMYAHRDDLTDLAQQALAEVMRQRNLAPQDGESQAPSEGDTTGANPDQLVYMFHDAFEAREAMRHLSAAGIGHAMHDWHEVETGMRFHPSGLDLGLTVDPAQRAEAVSILKEKLGLFPDAETGAAHPGESPDSGLVLLSMFDLVEGLIAARVLAEAGISFYWRDGRDEPEALPDAETVAIEVRPERLQRASSLVEAKLDAEA